MQETAEYLSFGQWRYLRSVGKLQHFEAQESLTLEPRLHKLLNYFIDHSELVLSRDTLLSDVWGDGAGSDEALTRAIAALRKILQDSRTQPTYIATLSKKGYCWMAAVKVEQAPQAPTIPAGDMQPVVVEAVEQHQPSMLHWQWQRRLRLKKARHIWVSSLVLILFSLGFVFLFNQMNQKASLPRYLHMTPLSAQDGTERMPLLDNLQSILLYQHNQAADDKSWRWAAQQLNSMQVRHDSAAYQQLSEANWLNAQEVIFRAVQHNKCAFWRQQVQPEFGPASTLFSCHYFVEKGQVRMADGLLWLDKDPETGQMQLWHWKDHRQHLMLGFPADWRDVSHLLYRLNKAYMLVQLGYSQSMLIELDLESLIWRELKHFDFRADQLAWWDEQELLINHGPDRFAALSLRTGNERVFGELTTNLADVSRVADSLLAVSPKESVTDLLQLQWAGRVQPEVHSFAPSNRAERLMLRRPGQYYFMSERSGLPQLWLLDNGMLRQLTSFTSKVRVEQLLWWQQQLWLVIEQRLWSWDEKTGNLTPLFAARAGAERFTICDDKLYWTERDTVGWALFQWHNNQAEKLLDNSVNVLCGPQHQLVLQSYAHSQLQLLEQGKLRDLRLALDWRSIDSAQMASDERALFWLTEQATVLNRFDWQSKQTQTWRLPQPVQALYLSEGEVYAEQARTTDVDVVWLHPEL
ncbi:winged helix-turn-helix domain-containing protein [Rheinheimera sp.]|uniref:winged helix-turn-helix domain-containing protein n=1 Tax=Rheinheimera sp. TaxID=1869214 RepID=UPI003AF9281F